MTSKADLDAIFDKIADLGADVGVMEQAQFVFPLLLPIQGALNKDYPQPSEHPYGSHPKQKLDVYVPRSLPDGKKAPIMVFLYGGGFAMGGKRHAPGVYQCLGNFFAEKGYVVAVVDYRLIGAEGAKFPSGSEDISAALQWLAKGAVAQADLQNIFLMGESAGGMHLCNYLWRSYPHIKSASQIPEIQIRGLIFLSIAFSREPEYIMPPVLAYYGSAEAAAENWATNLRQKSDDKTPLLVLYAEYDPVGDIAAGRQPFLDLYKDPATAPSEIEVFEAKRHNHITLPLTLGTNHLDEWAHHTASWMERHVSK